MNEVSLHSYIRNLDSKTVLEQLLDGQSSGVLGEAVYQKIEERLTNHSEVDSLWETLDKECQEDLLKVYLSSSEGVENESLTDRNALLKTFYVYESTLNNKSTLFSLNDTYPVLKNCFLSLLTIIETPQSAHRTESVLQDSAIVLTMIRGGRLKRRIDGTIQKGALDEFARTSVIGLGVSKKDSLSISLYLELILSTLKKAEIVYFTDMGFVISENGDQYWEELLNTLSKDMIEQVKHISPFGNISILTSLLEDGASFTVESAAQWGITDSLRVLVWCGEAVFDGIQWSRGTPKNGYSVQSGHIMPDFSVMVPREISATSLYEFLQIGEIDSVDVIYKAVISKDAVADSLSLGITEDEIISLFKRWNASEHLIHSVVEWIAGFDRVFIDGNYLAVSSSIETQLLQQVNIAQAVTSFSNYSFYRIRLGSEGELKNRLEGMGFDVRIPFQPEEVRAVLDNPQLQVYLPVTPNYSPNLTSSEPVQTHFGRYGGPLRKHSEGDLLKLVRFAILMEEKMAVQLEGKPSAISFTPINVHSGDDGKITGKDGDGSSVEFPLKKIEKAGVVNDV